MIQKFCEQFADWHTSPVTIPAQCMGLIKCIIPLNISKHLCAEEVLERLALAQRHLYSLTWYSCSAEHTHTRLPTVTGDVRPARCYCTVRHPILAL